MYIAKTVSPKVQEALFKARRTKRYQLWPESWIWKAIPKWKRQ